MGKDRDPLNWFFISECYSWVQNWPKGLLLILELPSQNSRWDVLECFILFIWEDANQHRRIIITASQAPLISKTSQKPVPTVQDNAPNGRDVNLDPTIFLTWEVVRCSNLNMLLFSPESNGLGKGVTFSHWGPAAGSLVRATREWAERESPKQGFSLSFLQRLHNRQPLGPMNSLLEICVCLLLS